MAPIALTPPFQAKQREVKDPPVQIWHASEPPFVGHKPIDSSGYQQSTGEDAIIIDNGSSSVRAGWSFDKSPRYSMPPIVSRYKDRKLNRTFLFTGSDVYADGTARSNARGIYEPGTNIVWNWDAMESVLDTIFIKLGLAGDSGGLDRPVVMTEAVTNLGYARRTMNEMLFELYSVPKVAYGVDSLFSFYYNDGNSGLVVSSGYTSTTLIPIVDRKPLFNYASRLNWGRSQNAEFLKKLLALKYPAFGSKPTDPQLEDLVREHCYVAQDYQEELNHYLDWSGSEDRDHIVQWPFTETIIPQKTEEELAAAAEKRRLNGVRLQEQAAKMRLEKLVRKEQELEYYKDLQQRIAGMTKKDARLMLESDDFDDEGQLHKRTKELEKSIRKARNRDVGDLEEEPEEVVTYPLLETPDADLDEDGLKQKRLQRLMKANADARARAKAEKEVERLRKAEEERIDTERRTNDFEAWIGERRIARQMILQKIKDRDRLKAQLGDRKSLATQLRMKSIANLASDNPSKKRRRGGDDDTFGADDADWSVYRQIAMGEQSDDEEEQEDLNTSLKNIEKQLLQHDPTFNEDSTREAQSDWTKSLVHTFLRGPWPHDPESQREQHQMHLNVERIRVPEVVFQPSIAGLDQAGIVEIAGGLLTQSLQDESQRGSILEDIFLTSGNTLFQGFEARLRHDLRSLLPAEAPMKVRSAKDPIMDAWRGAAKWASSANAKMTYVTAAEYADQGADYMKEHDLGNMAS